MLRKAIRVRPLADGAIVVRPDELGRALFALAVEFVPPSRGVYRIRAKIVLKSESVLVLIDNHHLRDVEVFTDKAWDEADKQVSGVKGELAASFDRDPIGHYWSLGWVFQVGSLGVATFKRSRKVKILFGSLLHGIEVKGGMDELSFLAHTLSGHTDKLAAKLAAASSFEDNDVRIVVPGDKEKPKTPGVRPGNWGR